MRQARPHTVRQSWSMEVATALRRMRLHLVAFFLTAGNIAYTNDDPAQQWLSRFGSRQDNQIMSLVWNPVKKARAGAAVQVLAGTNRDCPGFGHVPPRDQGQEGDCVQ